MMKKCLIICSKIELDELHSMSLTIWLTWQHTRFQIFQKAFLATFSAAF